MFFLSYSIKSFTVHSVLVLSLHSADDTDVEEEEMMEEEDEEELEEEVDSDVFPSMMIITLFSAGVPSAQQ